MAEEEKKTVKSQSSKESKLEEGNVNPEQLKKDAHKDMGKVAIIISVLAFFLVVVFFFGLRSNINSLNAKMEGKSDIQERLASMDKSITWAQKKIAELENVPQKAQKVIYMNTLNELEQKTQFLSNNLDGADQEKVQKVKALLKEIQASLQK